MVFLFPRVTVFLLLSYCRPTFVSMVPTWGLTTVSISGFCVMELLRMDMLWCSQGCCWM